MPTMVVKYFPATTANVVTNLTTQDATYLAVDINGVIHQSSVLFTPTQTRDWIPIGNIVHSNKTFINLFNNSTHVAMSPANQLGDLMDGMGAFNINGNVFSPNGTNLSINKTLGNIFKQGSNYFVDMKDPHTLMLAALNAPSNIRYRLSNGFEYSNTSVIDPGYYDNQGLTSAARVSTGGNTTWSIQRIYLSLSGV